MIVISITLRFVTCARMAKGQCTWLSCASVSSLMLGSFGRRDIEAKKTAAQTSLWDGRVTVTLCDYCYKMYNNIYVRVKKELRSRASSTQRFLKDAEQRFPSTIFYCIVGYVKSKTTSHDSLSDTRYCRFRLRLSRWLGAPRGNWHVIARHTR